MSTDSHLDEANGAGQTITHSISSTNYVSTDAANAVAADYPITPNTNSYKGSFQKFTALHVNSLSGVTQVQNVKFWRYQGSPTSGDVHKTNATTSGYAQKTYATPSTALMTFYNLDTSEPSGANVGINGSLTGTITNLGVLSKSDYVWHQVQVSSSTTSGATLTLRLQWDEVA